MDSGVFDLQDESLTRYSEVCPNAVVETSKVPKEEVSVAWTSPSEGSGCVFIRATILETPDTWYMDDPNLVLKICQDSKAEADDQGPVLQECCACDEAKYEVTFEGLWSRNTHPKDFPSKGWTIRFSDVIGASHTVDYRFWQYNGMASAGLKQVAERGSTRKLESELKDQSEHIRTIIKARGISYPNVTGKTFAVFRVDRKHHLMSLVSMLDPSPDWIVGVSGLELCTPERTWIEHKELNLYPYDAGTDDGITYLSPDSPTEPQEPIRRITSTFPNDSRSPFYDPSGLDMKPLAKLYLNRQRLYEKSCEDAPGDAVNTGAPPANNKNKACRVTQWGPWDACSVTCGRGTQFRQRHYLDEAAAVTNNCNVPLSDKLTCFGKNSHCKGERHPVSNTEMCALENWSSWSSCTTTCGPGHKTRSRNFREKKHRKICKAGMDRSDFQQTIDCENEPCPDEDADEKCPEDRYTQWSDWSPCSSSCGPGVQLRSRLVIRSWGSVGDNNENLNIDECKLQQTACVANIPTCDFTKKDAEQSLEFKGIQTDSQVMESPEMEDIDCQVSEWSNWSKCIGCTGYTVTTREILVPPKGNGKNCPKKLRRKKKCHKIPPCSLQRDGPSRRMYRDRNSEAEENQVSVDCKMTQWSPWSRCTATCGDASQYRTRIVKVEPSGPRGKLCPALVEYKKCHTVKCP
nr:PREDICTED: spondin-1-like isoform X6 [Megachile rotundata]